MHVDFTPEELRAAAATLSKLADEPGVLSRLCPHGHADTHFGATSDQLRLLAEMVEPVVQVTKYRWSK